MRGHLPALLASYPLGATLPSVYQQDGFAQELCAALDEVLAPVYTTLDSLPAYFDPATTPTDLLDWLAAWLGITLGGHESAERQRELIAAGARLLPWRGTVRGIRGAVAAATGQTPDITESGGTAWSTDATTATPGAEEPLLVVRLRNPDGVDLEQLSAVICAIKPAHLPHRIETGTP